MKVATFFTISSLAILGVIDTVAALTELPSSLNHNGKDDAHYTNRMKSNRQLRKSSKKQATALKPNDAQYVWTKLGLEQIPWDEWKHFSEKEHVSLYIDGFPFPGDTFTKHHYDAWKAKINQSSIRDLVNAGYIIDAKNKEQTMKVFEKYSSVPTLFSDPIILQETAIDYRLQYAADIGSHMIGKKAALGRLVNPSGRRLREHFYRFPDQCDATPIALEVFLRLMIYDQIEAFFHSKRIGLWHDLFQDVQRRSYNSEELSVARWYGERYAENYLHKITNGWVYPLRPTQNIDTYMIAVGLDPYDTSEDTTTATGLGNVVGKRVTEWMNDNDGLMRSNDFVDTEGLDRIADYHQTQTWHHWKPSLAGSSRFQGIRNGIVTQQTFVSPSLGIFSFLYEHEDDFQSLKLESIVPPLDMSEEAYIQRSKEFLKIQAKMTDREKAVAELSNSKISGSVFLICAYVPLLRSLAPPEDYSMLYDEFSMVTSGCAEYAATHAAWRHKRTYYSGRPETIIRHLAKNNVKFKSEFPQAINFKSMIPSGDHPEYPSGSSAIYSAFAQAGDDWFLDKFNVTNASSQTGSLMFTVPASKFYWTEGPSTDITLEYKNLKEWIDELPVSRVYGGVHFMDAGIAGVALGKEVGHACSRLLKRLRNGDMAATYTFKGRQKVNPFNK